ncbi:Crp/Fnr family transcriptional regulator [Pseudohoeflea suaedae]|nr:Crp/Fnr family transcriptional regulator [Pseudohoeflea suaedae]
MDTMRERVMRRAKVVEYERGDTICGPGSGTLALRYMSSGTASVLLPTPGGGEVLMGAVFKGMTVNISEMISGVNTHIFRATTKCIIYELYSEEFLEQCKDPQFLRWCMWIMSRNIMFLSEFSSVRGIRNADLRLMEFLRVMAFLQTGSRPTGSFCVDWALSQQLLAELVNVSRPYLNERISRLQAEGVLKITGNSFEVIVRGN